MTRKYELMYILNPSIGDEALTALAERIQALIEAAGTIETVDAWGKKRLAYEINDQRDGYYGLINFSADAEFPRELERNLKNMDDVMRYLVVRTDD
ncbi:MAG: 30S ribosomal protein S6 [Eubacteriales bacterium]|nr:30S ribosomal protein S6 [Eubacteriales bacterium]MDD3867827.1 30S ribosomal protein S6 [Eubacteriales bacterium]MDD4462008.1 30S ribosomal protein S6 [Eubacteriales bacterium]